MATTPINCPDKLPFLVISNPAAQLLLPLHLLLPLLLLLLLLRSLRSLPTVLLMITHSLLVVGGGDSGCSRCADPKLRCC